MIQNAYSVYDSASATYGALTMARTHAEALRSFQTAIDQEGHAFHTNAKDYTLFYVGQWDDQKAKLIDETNIGLGNALEMTGQQDPATLLRGIAGGE